MKNILMVILLTLLTVSCTRKEESSHPSFPAGNGVLLVNEGNFMGGNGSISFFSYDSAKIYNDLFSSINGRPLGDVPNSAGIIGDKAYIVVNNSGKVEVIKKSTFQSLATIKGLVSPRNIEFVSASKAYVTSMYTDSLIILDLVSNSISGYINLRRTSESIVIAGEKAFVANWVDGHEIMVVNTAADAVIDSVEVGVEPESMVVDRDNMVWVLCNGGWMRENFAELDGINSSTLSIDRHYVFPTIQESPTCLRIDGAGDNLYFLDGGVRKMSISAASIPETPMISESGHVFYKIGVDPYTNDLFVTDAIDYQQKGYLLFYGQDGTLLQTLQADIIPGYMCFRHSAGR